MSEKPLEFGMVCVVAKLTLCHVFQRVCSFVVYEDPFPIGANTVLVRSDSVTPLRIVTSSEEEPHLR